MQVKFQVRRLKEVKADLLAVFVPEEESEYKRSMNFLTVRLGKSLTNRIVVDDFSGKEGESCLLYPDRAASTRRLLLVGLGKAKQARGTARENELLERYRRAAATAAKRAKSLKASLLALHLPVVHKQSAETIVALAEGAGLGVYRFDKYMTKKEEERPLEQILLCTEDRSLFTVGNHAADQARVIVEATFLARNLANAPGNEIYPETLAQAAQESAERCGYTATIFDEAEIARLGMGGILGVSRGSARAPRFIILEYGPRTKRPVVLVGKGVTFDTGGISIKPSAGMAEMKMDMSGAAAVIGTFEAVSRLKLPVHIIGLIPAVENMPGASATRPGDILRHYNGKTSEVDNTDAEGRLILADALAYAEQYKPAAVIDLATLTGACVVALGHHATGMMGNDDELMAKLTEAGNRVYERVWPLPLFDEYEKLIKSDVADVKNVGGRWAGAITAAWFLKKFIGSYRWVHLDIAGTAILEENGDYTQKGASGVGVRLLTEYLRRWKS